jgi:hypothetical protein
MVSTVNVNGYGGKKIVLPDTAEGVVPQRLKPLCEKRLRHPFDYAQGRL